MAKHKRDRSAIIFLIAFFKLVKALLLICVGIGAFKLMNKDLNETLTRWAYSLGVDPRNHYLNRLLVYTLNFDRKKLELLGIGTFIYAGLFGIEGTGLFIGARWAEYMVIITTAGLMPLEIYEIFHHPSALKIATLVINALAVVYLIFRVRKLKKQEREQEGESESKQEQSIPPDASQPTA
ncbi:MAG: DUF2127 domain-containing protein [Phycisphaerae bacterium]|nr:DUF2127 domain-containing protein [Phycisphaerae bacterium]